jgi:hypothetical protein
MEVHDRELDEALTDIREGLQADGFDLLAEVATAPASSIRVSVVASEDACGDCLVPKDIFESIVRASLPSHLRSHPVELTYPTD